MNFSIAKLRLLSIASTTVILLAPFGETTSHRVDAADPLLNNTKTANPFGIPPVAGGNRDGRDERDRPQRRPTNIREGTLLPPTSGRVALIGRRWAFVPASSETAPQPLANPAASPSVGAVTFGSSPARSQNAPRTTAAQAGSEPVQWMISENLMLQRVVEAIRIDPSDDRWTISGEVTEFFDQNRIIIRTAQRSNAN